MKLRLPSKLQAALIATLAAAAFTSLSTGAAYAEETPLTFGADLGDVMYVGDSITHGIAAASWRWSMHKIFVDAGVSYDENGYNSGNSSGGVAAGTTYGGVAFENVHSAHSGGDAYEVIGRKQRSGGHYGNSNIYNWLGVDKQLTVRGSSTGSYTGTVTDHVDTFLMLIGTNDMLSSGNNPEAIAGAASDALVQDISDIYGVMQGSNSRSQLVLLSIPTWGTHANNNTTESHQAVAAANAKVKAWADKQANVTYVDVNTGLIDVSSTSIQLKGVDSFYRAPGTSGNSDGLHPNAQGELIIAGNVAQAMGYAGRSVGLERSSATAPGEIAWTSVDGPLTVTSETQTVTGASFTIPLGYTVDFSAVYGNGGTDQIWNNTDAFSITVGDGTHSGTLSLTEAYVKWDNQVLYSRDNSESGNFRIAYINSSINAADNVTAGYYVWLGDKLIGEGLASSGTASGISMQATGAGATVSTLSWTDAAYAPTTTGYVNNDAAFKLVQVNPSPSHDNPVKVQEDFAGAEESTILIAASAFAHPEQKSSTSANATGKGQWFAGANALDASGYTGNLALEITGSADGNAIFGIVHSGKTSRTVTGDVTMQMSSTGTIAQSTSGASSIVGGYYGSITGKFRAVVNSGTLQYGITGGYHIANAGDYIGSVEIDINGGSVQGNVYGGSINTANGKINGNIDIIVTGGTVTGSIIGTGTTGTIGGESINITLTGGVVNGDVMGRYNGFSGFTGTTSVTVDGSLAYIGGDISADIVTVNNVASSPEHYTDRFDSYRGTIRADKVVLHHYTVEQMLASLETKSLVLSGGTATTIRNLTLTACEITAEDTSAVTLDGTLTLGNTATYSGNVTLTNGMTIKMVGGENTSASGAAQGGYRSGSWEVMKLAEGETAPSLTVTPETLVGAGMLQGSEFSYNSTTGLLSAEGTDYTTYYLEGSITSVNLTTEQAAHAELQHVVLNAAAGTVTVDSGASNTLADITKQAGSALTLDVAGSLTLSGTITGTGGSIEKTGAGTVTLNGASRSGLSDSITVSAGSLVAAVDNSLTSGAVTVNENGTLVLKTYTGVPTISGTGTVQIDFGSGKDYQIHDKAFLDSFGGTVELVSGNLQIGNKTNKFNNAKLKLSGGVLKGWGANFTHAIELAGGTIADANDNQQYSGAISVTANSTVDASSGHTITLSGALTGTGEITKAGAGTLKLSGNNTGYEGGLYADAGTVNITTATTLGSLRLGSGALNIKADTTVNGTFTIGPANNHYAGTLTVDADKTLTVDSIASPWGFNGITVNGALTVRDGGQFSITSNQNNKLVSGTGVINTPQLNIGNASTVGIFAGGVTLNIGNGGITGGRPVEFRDVTVGVLESSNGWSAANAITLAAGEGKATTFEVGADKTVTLNGAVSGSGSLVKAGAGTLTLSGNNTFTGGFAVNAGSLVITRDITTTGLTGTGGTLDVQGALTVNTVEEPGASFGGTVAADSFTVSGSGYQTISGISRLGSSIQVNGGTLHLAAGTYDISGLTPSQGGTTAPETSGYGELNATVQFITTSGSGDFDEDGGLDIVYKGNHATTVSEDGIVHFEGTDYSTYYLVTAGDTLNLTQEQGAHPELQNVVVNASGSVSLDDTRTITSLSQTPETVLTLTGGGELTIRSFGFEYFNDYANISVDAGTRLVTGAMSVDGGQTYTVGGAGNYTSGALTLLGDATVNLGATTEVASVALNSNGHLNISGVTTVTGTTDLSVASASTGVITVKETGTLNVNGNLWGRNVSHLYMEQGGTVNIGSSLSLVGAAADAELVAGGDNVQYSLGSNSWTIKNADATITSDENITIANLFSGNGSLVKLGAGTLTLTAANTFTGDLLISGGTVKVGNNSALGASGASHRIEVAANGTLDVNGSQGTNTEYTIVMNGGTLTNTGGDMGANLRQVANHLVLEANSKVKAEKNFGLIANGYNPSSLEMGGHTLTIDGPGTFFVVNATITGGGAIDVHSGTLSFNNGGNASQRGTFASNFVLSGGTLTGGNVLPLANDIYINTTANSTMSLPVQRQGHAITFKGDANLTVSSDLTGPGSIAKEGTGALTLSGTTDVSGTIQLTGGTLNLTPGQGKSVNFNFSNPDAFEKFGEESMGYSYQGTSGYLTGTAQYYLVKGAANTTASHSGAITGATYVDSPEGTGAGDVIVSVTRQGSGTYYVNQNMTYGEDEGMASATDFAIKKGFTLSAADSGAYSPAKQLHGEGTYALANNAKALNSGLSLGTDWTGAVRISGYSFANDMNALNSLANSGSWVELVGVHGWSNSVAINANLILGADSNGWSYYQDNGNNNQVLTFNGLIKGTGKFGRSNTTGQNQTHVFTNDISGWTGTYEARSADDRSTTLRLTNNAHEVNATLTKMSGVFNVDVQTDVAFSKAITATTLAVTDGHTATLGANVTLGGLTGAGNIASTANITLNGTGTYVFDGAITDAKVLTKSGNGTQTFNGKVTLSGGRNSISAGTVYFNGGLAYGGTDSYVMVTSGGTTHFGGTSDLSGKSIGAGAGSAIVLDAGASLKLNELMNSTSDKGSGNGTLEMNSGSELTVAGRMYLTGASSDGGTIHLGNGSTVNLYAGVYQPNIMEFGLGAVVLDGAATTIQTANWGGTVVLDSIAGNGTLTLKANADSTVRNTFSIGGNATKSEFTGTIALERVAGKNRVLLAEFNDKGSAAGAVVEASLTGGHTSEAVGILINSDVVQMKGLKDGSNITNANSYALASGSASRLGNTNGNSNQYLDNASDGTSRTLEIVGDDEYTTAIKVLSGVNLKMSGAGSQTFNGDLSAMNGTVTASAGTLTLNNTGAARGTLASVNYNGGTLVLNNMNVAGTTTIGEGTTLDLGATNLTSAIVNHGTVNFTQNITASGLAKEGADVSYQVGADDARATNGNYFYQGQRTESTLRVVTGGTVNPGGHKVTQDNVAYTLKADGTATGVSADTVDYGTFYQGEAGSTLQSSLITTTAEAHKKLTVGVVVDRANLIVDSALYFVQVADANITNTVDTDNIPVLQIAGGDNTLVGSVRSLPEMTLFVKGAAGSLKMQNATATPYQMNAGSDITFADNGSVTVRAAVAEEGSEQFDVYSLNNARFTVEANTMQAMNTGNVTVNNHLKVVSIATGGAGSLTLANGVEETLKNVTALNGDIQFFNMAAARGTTSGEQTQVGLDSLYIGSSKTVSFYENGIVDAAQEASVTVSGTLTAGSGAQLNANLEMASGSTLDVSGTGGMGLLMGSTVTLNKGMNLEDYSSEWSTWEDGTKYALFSGVDGLSIGASMGTEAIDYTQWVDAKEYFTNIEEANRYFLCYDGAPADNQNGVLQASFNGSNVGMVYIMVMPEPTTGTLSLLALAALAARRRRRS